MTEIRPIGRVCRLDDFISRFNGEPLRYRDCSVSQYSQPKIVSFVSQQGFRIIVPVGSTLTTPWPPANVYQLAFSIERQPRVVGSTIALSTESSIDMEDGQGYGGLRCPTPTFWAGTTGTVPPQVSVLFDDRGTLRELIVDAGERRMIDGAVFLLNWQGRSSWPDGMSQQQ